MIAIVAGGAAVAGFVQGLTGFGFGLVAMAVWAWVLEPQLAAPLSVFGALTGQSIAAFTVRRRAHWAELMPYLLGGLAGVPLGAWLLPRIEPAWFQALIGGLLALWCPLMLFSERLPRVTAGGRLADALVGAGGGFSGAIGGFTGALPTLWTTLRGLPKETQRAVVQNFNLALLAVTFAVHTGTGIVTVAHLPLFALVAPALLIPVLAGTRVYAGLSPLAFRRVVLALLTASGVALLVRAVPRLI